MSKTLGQISNAAAMLSGFLILAVSLEGNRVSLSDPATWLSVLGLAFAIYGNLIAFRSSPASSVGLGAKSPPDEM